MIGRSDLFVARAGWVIWPAPGAFGGGIPACGGLWLRPCPPPAPVPDCFGKSTWNGDHCVYPHVAPAPAPHHPKPSKPAVKSLPATAAMPALPPKPIDQKPTTTGSVAPPAPLINVPPAQESVMLLNALLVTAAAAVVTYKLGARLLGSIPLVAHTTREATAARNVQHSRAQRRTEWHLYARMSRQTFAAEMRRHTAGIENLTRRADACYREADLLEASWLYGIPFLAPAIVSYWRKLAERHVEAAYKAQDEESRILDLMRDIETARATQRRDSSFANARYLLRLLDSANDDAAQDALDRLYRLRGNIEWLDVVPRQMAEPQRVQAAKLLRLATATQSVNEARVALSRFKHLLRANGATWEAVFA
jgi:hypothetical protein